MQESGKGLHSGLFVHKMKSHSKQMFIKHVDTGRCNEQQHLPLKLLKTTETHGSHEGEQGIRTGRCNGLQEGD